MQSPYIVKPSSQMIWHISRRFYGPVDRLVYYDSGIAADRDLKMLYFLLKHKAATISQIARVCYPGKRKIREHLRRLAGGGVIDCFSWGDANLKVKPLVYCPNRVSQAMLEEYYPEMPAIGYNNWRRRSVQDAAAILLANEFVIRAGTCIYDYSAEPCFNIGRYRIVPTASFTAGGTALILLVLRGNEQTVRFTKDLPIYEQLVEASVGLKGYRNPSVLLLVCETIPQALDTAAFISANSTLSRYRITTDSEILFKPPHQAFFAFEKGRLVVRAANIFKASFDNVPEGSTNYLGYV